jgi:hypothetical protein
MLQVYYYMESSDQHQVGGGGVNSISILQLRKTMFRRLRSLIKVIQLVISVRVRVRTKLFFAKAMN